MFALFISSSELCNAANAIEWKQTNLKAFHTTPNQERLCSCSNIFLHDKYSPNSLMWRGLNKKNARKWFLIKKVIRSLCRESLKLFFKLGRESHVHHPKRNQISHLPYRLYRTTGEAVREDSGAMKATGLSLSWLSSLTTLMRFISASTSANKA